MRKNQSIPLFSLPFLFLGFISLIIYLYGRLNPEFAEWIVSNLGYPLRKLLAYISGSFDNSIAETIIILFPLALFLVILCGAGKNTFKARIRYLISLLTVISILWSGYVYTLGIGYFRTHVEERMNLPETRINEENLYNTLLILQENCELLLDDIEFDENGSSISDMDFKEISNDICDGYERLAFDYPSLEMEVFDTVAKEVMMSKLMTYLEILGIYTFFTGEANINIHYPDYNIPSTIAHEFAHQRGISREDEANFIAFLVCIRADDPYIKYSGYINMFEIVASALSKTNKELLGSVYENMDSRLYSDMKACSEFYYEHKVEILADISNFFNDNYLKSQGTAGTVSYGMAVKLCVYYYCNE